MVNMGIGAWRSLSSSRRAISAHAQASIRCSFYLAPLDGAALPAFLPGQFLTFAAVAGDDQASPLVRCCSLSAPPDPTHYRITVKRTPAPAGRSFRRERSRTISMTRCTSATCSR